MDVYSEARAWIADCTWADEVDADSLTDDQAKRGIQRHYYGGWAGFLADFPAAVTDDSGNCTDPDCPVWH